MTVDAFGLEPHFVDHLAPIWSALPDEVRGTFFVDHSLVERAEHRGIAAVAITPDRDGRPPGPTFTGRLAMVASIGDTKVARRLGYGPFIRVEHGAGQGYRGDRSGSYAGGPGNEDAALVLAPNGYSAALWRAAYPGARVEVVGSPRLDGLPRRVPGPGPVVAVTFHWPGPDFAGTAWGYFRDELPVLAKRFTVIGHEHPNWTGRRYANPPSRNYARMGIEFVADFDDVCRRADLLVFDNTSVGYEFAATGRPVVVLNAKTWSRSVHQGLRFWEAADVGPNADRSGELIPAVARALELRPDDVAAREQAVGLVYPYRTGGAQRAAAAIADWLATRAEVAA